MFENYHLYECVTFHKPCRHIFTWSWISIYSKIGRNIIQTCYVWTHVCSKKLQLKITKALVLLTLRFKIKWKNGGQIHETWHIHTDGFFQTNFSFLYFSSKFQLPHLANIHAKLLYWFWNDIGDKNLRKTIFEFYQFPVKIILVGLCLKALNSIEKLHHPS